MSPELERRSPSKPRLFYGWLVALGCTLITLANGGIFFTFGIFFKPVAFDFGWSRSQFATNYGVMLAAYAPGSYFAGKLADRFGPRRVMLVSALLVALGYLGCARSQNLLAMFFGYAVLGFGLGATLALPTAIIQRWFLKLRGTMLGVVNAAMGLGGFIFAPLANSLITVHGWRASYLIIGGVFAGTIALAALFLVSEPKTKGLHPYGYEESGLKGDLLLKQTEGPTSLTQALKFPAFWGICALYTISFMPSFFISTHLVPYVTDRGITAASAAQGVGLMAAISAAGRLFMNWVAGRIGWMRSLVLCYVVAAASIVFLLYINTSAAFYLFAATYGISWGSTISLLGGAVASFFGLVVLSELMGLFLGVATLVGAPIPWLGGAVFDSTGTYLPSLVLVAIFYATAGLISWRLKPPKL